MPVMKQLRIGSVNYDTVGEASVTQTLTIGTKIATVTIDGTATDLYAPEGGSSIDPSSTAPAMDGTAAAGTSTDYARADHVHPTDTSRAAASHTHAIADVTGLQTALDGKQGTLVSGTSIKTVNGTSLLGSGDVTIPTYTLPAATTSTLGGVKVGDGLSVAADGTLSSTGMVVLEYGVSTWAECLEACEANRVVYCKVPSSSTNSRMAFLAWRESSKFEFQYYRSVSSHTDSQQGDEIYIYTLKSDNSWTTVTRQASTRVVAGDGLSSAYSNGTITLSAVGGGGSGIADGSVTTAKLADGAVTDAKLAQTGGVLEAVETIRSKQVAAAADVIYPNGNVFASSVNGSTPNRIRAKWMWLDAGSLVELVDQSGIYMGVDGFSVFWTSSESPYGAVPATGQYGVFTSGWIKTPYIVPTSAFVLISIRKDDNSVFTGVNEMDGLIRVTKSRFAPPLSLDAIVQRQASSSLDMFGLHFGRATLSSGNTAALDRRVSTPIAVTCNSSILFVAKSGFKFGIHTFINGSFSADSGWQTSYRVPAGTTFKMIIARDASPEPTDPADVELFTSSVMAYDEVQQALGPVSEQAMRLPRNNWITSAHRGFVPAGSGLHENTLAAFYLAAENGAEMIELDARLTSDGVLISNHDATVTGKNAQGQTVTYTIANETAATICSVILSQDNTYGTQYVPTLEQVLNLAYNTGMDVNIDLKNGYSAAEQAAKTVWKCGMRGHVVYALNGSGMQAINKIIELDPQARFIDTPSNFTAETLASLDDYESRCFAYTSDVSAGVISGIRDSGCMLAIIGLTSSNFAAAIAYHPEMCEFPHTSDFRSIEIAHHDNRQLY